MPRRLLTATLALSTSYVVLSLSVHAGLWRALDLTLAVPAARETSCTALRAGFAVSQALSAEVTTALSVVCAAALWWRTRHVRAAAVVAGLLLTAPVEFATKHLVDQPPPRQVIDGQRPECGPEGYRFEVVVTPYTYPSGSVTRLAYFTTLAIAAVLPSAQKPRATKGLSAPYGAGRTGIAALLIAVACIASLTRVTIGWHWPTDVAAGALLGSAAACVALYFLRRQPVAAAPRRIVSGG